MPTHELSPFDVIVLIGFSVAAVKIFVGPIGQAIADRIRGARDAPSPADPALLAELDQLRGRLTEVEERLDFAERLLARAGQPDQIPGGAIR
jgi:hypothetical protein